MSARPSLLVRLRVVVLGAILGFTTFAVGAVPASIPLPRPEALTPDSVAAASYCASEPNMDGRLTASSTSTTAVSRITSSTVYPYVSNVNTAWSCTASWRYSGVAWNTSSTLGSFDWGNLLNSDTIACNFVVGSTDYLKANSTTDCPDSDAEYALQVTLSPQGVYQNDATHDSTGDFSYIHSTCITYYTAEPTVITGQSFSTGNTNNRPGANCHALFLDGTNTTQTVTYDSTAPTLDFVTPDELAGTAYRASGSYTLTFGATDAVAGFGGTSKWHLQRQIATISAPNTCATFADDPAAGNSVTGTTNATGQTSAQTLVAARCYRWKLDATDQNGNVASTHTSGSVLVDDVVPVADFSTPDEGGTTSQTSTSFSVAWTETDADSGIASRSLQRQKATYSAGSCGSYSNDGSADTGASPRSQSLTAGNCYRWQQTLTDRKGNAPGSPVTSGILIVDSASPAADFSTPDEATTTFQNTTSLSVAWSETAGSGTITSRSLQRQKATIGTSGTCTGLTYSNDGAADTNVSPRSQSLTAGNCYVWVQTLTNSLGKSRASTSGPVLVDTTNPTATLTAPAVNAPLAGTVGVTGGATDAGSFKEYELDYGAGATPGSWTTIAIYSSPVTITNPLGNWVTAGLDGVYTLRLVVRDLAGNSATDSHLVYLANQPRGDDSRFASTPFDLGGGLTLRVAAATGEASVDRDLFSIPLYGPSQALSLHYGSLDIGTSGRFGYGWVSNLSQSMTYDNGIAIWHRPDGGLVPFGSVSGTWTALAGHHESFARVSTEDTVTMADQSKLVFDNTTGRLKRIEDRFAHQLVLSWSSSTATATDASSRQTAMVIDGSGRITAVTDSAGRAWGFHYNGSGDLDVLTDPLGNDTSFAYTSHRLTGVTRVRSRLVGADQTITWTIAYTGSQATSVLDPISAGPTNTFSYGVNTTAAVLLKNYTGPVTATSTYVYDELGRVTSTTDPDGYTTTMAYDADSNMTSVVQPIDGLTSQTVTSTYDASGNQLTEVSQLDGSTSVTTVMTYNGTNDLLTRSDADGGSAEVVTLNTWSSGHLVSTDLNCTSSGTSLPTPASSCTGAGTQNASTNLITTYSYTAHDQLETETDPLGHVTKHTYDSNGNETSVITDCTTSGTTLPSPGSSCTAAGTANFQTNVTTTYAYNAGTRAGLAGLVTTETDPVGNATNHVYDDLGQETNVVSPGDASIPALTHATVYDDLGNVLSESDNWSGLGAPRTITHVYDLANRETSTTDPMGVVTTTTFDAAGDATSTTSNGVETDRLFDGRGNPLSETLGMDVTTHVYDGRGLVIETVDPELTTSDLTFDLGSRLIGETVRGSTDLTTQHAYDAFGRETSMTDPAGSVTASVYDRTGRLTSSTVDGAQTVFVYDRAANQVSTTTPQGIVTTTTYDPLDRATVVIANDVASPTLPSEDITTTTYYDAAGTTVAVRNPLGITLRTVPNVRQLAKTTIANCTDSGTTPTSAPASCLGAGTANDKTNVLSTISYDGAAGVLVRIVNDVSSPSQSDDDQTTHVAYDDAGRQIALMDPRGTVTSSIYDAAGRLTTTVSNCTEDTSSPAPPSLAGSWWTCNGSVINDGTWNVTSSRTYDSHGNLATETAPNGRVTTYAYDTADRLVSRTDNDVVGSPAADEDLTTYLAYDDAGRQSAVRKPTLDRTTFLVTRTFYDANGRVQETIDDCTNAGTTPPDDDEWATCVGSGTQDADTNIIHTYTYDAHGNRITEDDPDPSAAAAGPSSMVHRQLAYDSDDRLCRVVENATGATNLQTLTHPCSDTTQGTGTSTNNLSTRYTYDGAGRLASMIDAAAHTTTYAYDTAGRMTGTTDADSGTISWAYDPLGQRISQTDRSDGTPLTATVSWTYDGAGRMVSRVHETAPGLDGAAPTIPTGATATVVDNRRIDVSWTASLDGVGVNSYTVKRDGSVLTTVSGLVTSYRDVSAVAGVSHDYTVSATDAAGNSSSYSSAGTAAPSATTYSSVVLADSPVSYWALDETSGTTATDGPGTNDGTYVNGVTLSAAGPSAALPKAADFDGTNDYVGVTDSATLHQADGPLTLEAWIRGDSWSGGIRAIMGKSTNGYLLYVDATGHLVLAKRFVADIVKSTTTMSTGTWYHVAATKTGATTHLYINGVDVTGTVTNSTLADTTTALGFGTERGDQSSSPFDGRLAGLAVYSRVLTPTEVAHHWVAGTLPANATYGDRVMADGPVSYWPLDDPSGTVGRDRAGSNPATFVNGLTLSAAGPGTGLATAVDFDGSNDYVDVTDSVSLHQADGPLTLEAWIRGDSWSGGIRAIIGKSTNGYLLYVDASGHLVLAKRFVADIVASATTMATGTWYHVAATKTGSTTHLYIDGVDVTGTVTNSTLADTTTALGFGTERGDQSVSPFDGRMAGVAVFGRVLSASEVLADYAAAVADVHAPAIPTGLTVSAAGPDRIALSWTASTDNLGVAGYKIYRAGSYLTTVGSTSWTDLGRTAATSYGYTVSAIDAAGNESAQTGSSSATTAAASLTTTYSYDANGNKLTASDGTFTITSAYDRLNRVLTTDDEDAGTTADTTYTYSLTSPSWTDPTGTYGVTLDKFDRVTGLNDPADSTDFTTTYRADGQPATVVQPDGNTTTFGYDDDEHLTTKNTAAGGTSRAAYTWTVNAAGSILTEDSTISGDSSNGPITYAYDALGQLTGSTVSATTTAYGWDKTTNRTSVQIGAGTATTTTFDAANRPTAGTNPTLAYANDADGRLTARTGETMTYDHLGRLTAVKDASGIVTLATYTYDPLDRLRMIDYGGSTRIRFRYVGMATSVAQWIDDAAGTVTRSVGNGWDGQRLLDWTGTNSNIRIYGENAHHDVTWLASSSGTVSQALRYDPWGNPRAAVPSGYTPFRFQGSYYDATTDLSWVVTRWYAPLQGRFVTEDTLLGEPNDPSSRQLYAYAEGNPLGGWDPDGRYWFKYPRSPQYATKTIQNVAQTLLGFNNRWPAIWNANRTRWPQEITANTRVGAGVCIYIPVEWFVVASTRQKYARKDDPACLGESAPPYMNETIRSWLTAAQATTKLGTKGLALSFTRTQLYALTTASIGGDSRRPRNPDSSDWRAIRDRTSGVDSDARLFITKGNPLSAVIGSDVFGVTRPVSYQQCFHGHCSSATRFDAPSFCTDHTCTVGHYIFGNNHPLDDETLSHEYIHVLQYEGLGRDFYGIYASDLADAFFNPRKNLLEAPAYLWTGWISVLGRYERRPWQIWQRPTQTATR